MAQAQHIAVQGRRTVIVPRRSQGRSLATPAAVARPRTAALGLAVVEALIGYDWLLSALNKILSPTFRSGLAQQLTMAMHGNPNAWWAALMQRLVAAVPRIFGAKLAMGTIPEALEYLEQIPGFAPFILGNGLLEGMRQGIRGTVSPPLAATPELGVDLIRAIDEGRDEEARRLQDLASEVNDELIKYWKKYGRVAFAEALRALGFPIKQYPRWPTPTMAEEDRQAMLAVLKCARPATVG